MLLDHGGNIREIINKQTSSGNKILDFSSNINPLGISPCIKKILRDNTLSRLADHYPDPECKSLRQGLSSYLNIDADNIIAGNGSNEFIHLLPRVLGCRKALIYQPAFSEYELSLTLSRVKINFLIAQDEDDFSIDLKRIIAYVPKVELVILCNPNNPTGYLLKKEQLRELLQSCLKYKTYLLIDEAFIEFVEDAQEISLLRDSVCYKNLLVLRSLTKFFSLPGLRIGYLAAHAELIRKFKLFQPTWSVNAFVQEIAGRCIADSRFIERSKTHIKKERDFLFNSLKGIKGIYSYPPTANFILSKILNRKIKVESLSKRLINAGILIRDCHNFRGLDGRFFRVAVKNRDENVYLVSCLKDILRQKE